jgi:gas vesicle protein
MEFANQVLINTLGGLLAGVILLVAGTLLTRRDRGQKARDEKAAETLKALEALTAENRLMAARLTALQAIAKRLIAKRLLAKRLLATRLLAGLSDREPCPLPQRATLG